MGNDYSKISSCTRIVWQGISYRRQVRNELNSSWMCSKQWCQTRFTWKCWKSWLTWLQNTCTYKKTRPREQARDNWRKASATPVFKKGTRKDSGKYKVGLSSAPGKIRDHILLELAFERAGKKKAISNNQGGHTKGSSHLINPIALRDEMTRCAGTGRAVDVIKRSGR